MVLSCGVKCYTDSGANVQMLSFFALLFEDVFLELNNTNNETLYRNFVIGPITEELVFRSVIVSYSILTNLDAHHSTSLSSNVAYDVIWYCPIYFGLAHLHHLYESVRQGKPLTQSIIIILFQLTYTSIFGVIAGLLLVRTGNVLSCIASHVICNIIQLPDLSFMKPSTAFQVSKYSHLYSYRYILLLSHLLGLVLFYYSFFPLTNSLAKESALWNLKG